MWHCPCVTCRKRMGFKGFSQKSILLPVFSSSYCQVASIKVKTQTANLWEDSHISHDGPAVLLSNTVSHNHSHWWQGFLLTFLVFYTWSNCISPAYTMLAKSTEGDNRHLWILKFLLTLRDVKLRLWCGRTFVQTRVSPSGAPQNCLLWLL